MINLEDLDINGTETSLKELAQILKACPKITKLNFSYEHKEGHQENESEILGEISSAAAIKEVFKKLTSLKVTTSVMDPKEYVNDPWFFIFKMLRWV